jgi:hypothetical protein
VAVLLFPDQAMQVVSSSVAFFLLDIPFSFA